MRDMMNCSAEGGSSTIHQGHVARLEGALVAAYCAIEERDAAITQLEIKLNTRADRIITLKAAKAAADRRTEAVEVALEAMRHNAARIEGLMNALGVMRGDVVDQRDRAARLQAANGEQGAHIKVVLQVADTAREKLRDSVAALAAMRIENESLVAGMQAKEDALLTVQGHLRVQQGVGRQVVAALDGAKEQWAEGIAKTEAQVGALRLQLASAEYKAYLQKEESTRAAEMAGAREHLVADLEVQLQGSQGKLTPLKAQLSQLAKRLNSKEKMIKEMATAAASMQRELLAANEGNITRQMAAMRTEVNAERSFTTRLQVALASAEGLAFDAEERVASLELQLKDARQLEDKMDACRFDSDAFKVLRRQFEKRYSKKFALLEIAVVSEREAHRITQDALEMERVTGAAASEHAAPGTEASEISTPRYSEQSERSDLTSNRQPSSDNLLNYRCEGLKVPSMVRTSSGGSARSKGSYSSALHRQESGSATELRLTHGGDTPGIPQHFRDPAQAKRGQRPVADLIGFIKDAFRS